jgi:hypothetical protein
MSKATAHRYRPTEAKYKGTAQEMYVTYDLEQNTQSGSQALYPKVQRIYIAGHVTDWKIGTFTKRTGKEVHGVKIDFEQSRAGYRRKAYTATRGGKKYQVGPGTVLGGKSHFSKIVEVPQGAQNVRFHAGKLPEKYQQALQDVR